ncbi:MAG: response regulator [Clostridia bacterium]|nr:response regulator [Clostridia bacterium]
MSSTLGKRIRDRRMEMGLSQQQLANMMYVTRVAVANWEAGKRIPDLPTITQLADCLKVDVNYLIDAIRGSGERSIVMVVDDEPILMEGFMDIISEALPKADVRGFRNAEKALALARDQRITVAFLDIELAAGLSGIDLAKKLTEIDPKINIIFLTGHQEYSGAAWGLHVSGYILKPLTREKVLDEIEHLRVPAYNLL